MENRRVWLGIVVGLLFWVGSSSAQSQPAQKMDPQAKEILNRLVASLTEKDPQWKLKFKTIDPDPAFNHLMKEASTEQYSAMVQISGFESPEKASEILHGEALYASNGGGQFPLQDMGDEAIGSSHWVRVRQGKVNLSVTIRPNLKLQITDPSPTQPKSGVKAGPPAPPERMDEIAILLEKIARYFLTQIEQ